MSLTKQKYNDESKTRYESSASLSEITEKLGNIETLLDKYNIEKDTNEDTYKTLEQALVIGEAGLLRIERAISYRVYYISAGKTRKAHLVGFAGSGYSPDSVIIEKKGNQTVLPYKEIYISKREAKREKKGLQKYHLDKKYFGFFFPNKKYNSHTYLIETKKGSDTFRVYTKLMRTYWAVQIDKEISKEDLKTTYFLDIEHEFKDKREKFLNKQKKVKSSI